MIRRTVKPTIAVIAGNYNVFVHFMNCMHEHPLNSKYKYIQCINDVCGWIPEKAIFLHEYYLARDYYEIHRRLTHLGVPIEQVST